MTDRGRRLYDWWGNHAGIYRVVEVLSGPIRRRAVEELGLDGGETVVDVGCGPGGNLATLDGDVGASGQVIGLDYSAGMVRRASERAASLPATTVVRADAGSLPLPTDGVDAMLASLALSAMPEAGAAIEEVRRALRPGGRLVVADGRLPEGRASRPLSAVYGRVANWQGTDVLAVLREAFPAVEVVATYDAGLAFVAVATQG